MQPMLFFSSPHLETMAVEFGGMQTVSKNIEDTFHLHFVSFCFIQHLSSFFLPTSFFFLGTGSGGGSGLQTCHRQPFVSVLS